MVAEVSQDFNTGDLIILIPKGIKIWKLRPPAVDKIVTKIRITEELMQHFGEYLDDKTCLLDIDGN